jgi:hypothetical protein
MLYHQIKSLVVDKNNAYLNNFRFTPVIQISIIYQFTERMSRILIRVF